jgi:hypothetical protein
MFATAVLMVALGAFANATDVDEQHIRKVNIRKMVVNVFFIFMLCLQAI